jgi:hypothetical protein
MLAWWGSTSLSLIIVGQMGRHSHPPVHSAIRRSVRQHTVKLAARADAEFGKDIL